MMKKYLTVFTLLTSIALAALSSRNFGPRNQVRSAHAAHLRLLGRGVPGLMARQGCPSGDVPCGTNYCMPAGNVCCAAAGGDGSVSCNPGQWCVNQGSSCCTPGDVVCGAGCMPPGSVCCDNNADYCLAGQVCVAGNQCCSGSGCVAIASLPAGPPATSPGNGPSVASTAIASSTPVATTPAVSTLVFTTPAASTPVATMPVASTPADTTPIATVIETTPVAPTAATVSSSSSKAGAGPAVVNMGSELVALMAVAVALL